MFTLKREKVERGYIHRLFKGNEQYFEQFSKSPFPPKQILRQQALRNTAVALDGVPVPRAYRIEGKDFTLETDHP